MVIKLHSLKANLDREEAGDWIEYPDWPGVAFNVKSLHSHAYVTKRDFMMKRLARRFDGRTAPASVLAEEAGKIYSAEILFGWRGLDVEYTPETALEILCDPAYRNVVAAVEWCAQRIAMIDADFVEATVKNSERPSAGA